MSRRRSPSDYGKPDLKIVGFQLWVHGRELPDVNWLRVTAHCGAAGASIWASGAIVMVPDIAGFGEQCEAMHRGESSAAVLDPLEPELKVSLEMADALGHIDALVEITPDHLAQSHRMRFDLDQSYLPGIVSSCCAIVEEYPVLGSADG